jgi:hypothetical protein
MTEIKATRITRSERYVINGKEYSRLEDVPVLLKDP